MIKHNKKPKVKHSTKALTPALRESNRYIAFKANIKDESKITAKDLSKVLYHEIERLMGIIEYSKSSTLFMMELYDENTASGVIKTNRGYEDHVKATFCYVKKVNDVEIVIQSVTTSGSLKKAKTLLSEFNNKE